MKYEFIVKRNGIEEARIPATKKAAKEYVKRAARIGTHMGEWRRIHCGIEYATTVGVYYSFLYTAPREN